jgi:hypothetical protein
MLKNQPLAKTETITGATWMNKEKILRILLAMLAFGSAWGLLEAVTFSGLLHSYWGALFPYHICPCFLMASVFGSFIMGLALAYYKSPVMLVGIGIVAASFCWLAVPFLPVSVRSTNYGLVVASATAAIISSLSLALVAGLILKRLKGKFGTFMMVGALSSILAATLFILVTTYAMDKTICADLGYSRPLPDFLAIGGVVWASCTAVLLPVGHTVGAKLHFWLASRPVGKPSISYATLATVTLLCSFIGAAAFMIGL